MLRSLAITRPPLGPPPVRTALPRMRIQLAPTVALPTPWVAYSLPWHVVDRDRASRIADGLDALGVAVAGLRSEISGGDASTATAAAATPAATTPLSICPYRGDRYGLALADLQGARIVDLRLTPMRDAQGLARYSREQMRRWDGRAPATPEEQREAVGGIAAAAWPPDVASVEKLPGKVNQLRQLAPDALVCLSIDPDHLPQDLPAVVRAGADIVGLRADTWSPEHAAALATMIAQARDRLDALAPPPRRVHLMVVPPAAASPEDVIKILALGADLVAVDGWCEYLFNTKSHRVSITQWAAEHLGVSTVPLDPDHLEVDLSGIQRVLEMLHALLDATGVSSAAELGRHHLMDYGAGIPGVRQFGAPK